MYGLLAGIRVMDLTSVVLGPLATSLLGDLGADVIKVEPPSGDLFRATSPSRNPGMGAPYMGVNRNKRSIVIDLKTADGSAVLAELVKSADVLVHNMRPDAVERLGIGGATMRALNPRLIHCTTVGYGSTGPYADEPAYDDVVQGRVGIASLLGGDGPPRLAPTILADKITGLYCVQAILAALFARERTDEGMTVEVPMFESLTSFVLAEHMGGRLFEPAHGASGYNRLLNPYRKPHATADGYLVVLPYSTRHWRSVFGLVGRDDWLAAEWVADPEQRTRRVDELYAFLSEVMATRTTAEWLEAFASIDVPCAPVNTLDDLFSDDHLNAVGMFETSDHPTEGTVRLPRHPVTYDQNASADRPVAGLGEHTDEVLTEVGFDPQRIARLRAGGAIA